MTIARKDVIALAGMGVVALLGAWLGWELAPAGFAAVAAGVYGGSAWRCRRGRKAAA